MTRTAFILALAAAAALAGCSNEDHNIVGGPDDGGGNALANSDVRLPPSIAHSKIYRCKDNSVIYVDWLSDGSTRVKKSANEAGVSLPAGDPSLTGDAAASTITYNGQSCKA